MKDFFSRFLAMGLLCLLLVLLTRDYQAGRTGQASYGSWLNSLYRNQVPIIPSDTNADNPGQAAFREYVMTMDPATRRVPRRAWIDAARDIESRRKLGQMKSGISFEWSSLKADIGGRTRAIMYDPNDPEYNKVWAGCVTGGLWYTEDIRGEASWQPVNDFWPSLSVSCISYDPLDTETFFVGTGEGETAVIIYRESSGRGSGIWKSEDSGQNWTLLTSTEGFEYVTDIKVRNEEGASVIYAAVTSGIYKEETHLSEPGDGLYRSDDGGQSWTQVLPPLPRRSGSYAPSKIEIGPTGRIFVGTMRNVKNEGGGRILYSDDGRNWITVDDYVDDITAMPYYKLPGRVVLACSPSDENRVYAILAGGYESPDGFIRSEGVMMLRSDDKGETWTRIPMPDETGDWSFLAWHALTAVVHPTKPDVLWVGGLDLYRSVDKGENWQQISLWWNFGKWYVPEYPGYVHADQHSLIFRPGSTTELLNSNDGGVFLSANALDVYPAFMEKNHNYNTLQYYTCAMHPGAGEIYFLGGCQDNGTFRTTVEPTSKEYSVSYGDGAFCFIDENEPKLQISGSQFNSVYLSSDGKHEEVFYKRYFEGIFINPMDYDHINNTLYTNGMTFNGDHADTYVVIQRQADTALAYMRSAGTGSQVPFSAIRVLPWKVYGNTVFYAGTQSGRLFRISTGLVFPSSVDMAGDKLPPGNISCIQEGSTESQLLVTYSNYRTPHVWQTTDFGITWENKNGNLPDMPVRWAIFAPGSSSMVLLATELGVWYTEDIHQDPVHWQSCEDFPNVRVDMIRARDSDERILAATHGRGLFLSGGPVGAGRLAEETDRLRLYPNPARDHLGIILEDTYGGRVTIQVLSMEGRLLMERLHEMVSGNMHEEISLQELEPGSYILRIEAGEKVFSERFIKY